jgi:hypothetical protein
MRRSGREVQEVARNVDKQGSATGGKRPTQKRHPEEAWSDAGGSPQNDRNQMDRDEEYGNRALHEVAPTPNPNVGRGTPDKSG